MVKQIGFGNVQLFLYINIYRYFHSEKEGLLKKYKALGVQQVYQP